MGKPSAIHITKKPCEIYEPGSLIRAKVRRTDFPENNYHSLAKKKPAVNKKHTIFLCKYPEIHAVHTTRQTAGTGKKSPEPAVKTYLR